MTVELRNQLRERYGSKPARNSRVIPLIVDEPVEPERAFVTHAASGRTVITAPVREIARVNQGFTYLQGRFVEADSPNDNGAYWTTEDLQIGGATVAGGPLNWLHDDRKIIGSLLQGELVLTGHEEARKFSADQRKKAASSGAAMADGSFPIKNAGDLANAIKLAGNAKDPAAARRHIIKRARALGLSDRIPDTWKSEKSDLAVGNHIVADAAVWRFLFPEEAKTIEKAAANHELYYSMECVSREVGCLDLPGRPGCDTSYTYADYDAGITCEHLRQRSSVRRFIDPMFLGGAIIVPPVLPGWNQANATVMRAAASLADSTLTASSTNTFSIVDDIGERQARALAAAVLQWADR